MQRSLLLYADWLVQNAQSRPDLRGIRRVLAQRVLREQHLPGKQLEQHAAQTEHVRRHELLQVQRRRVQFFRRQIARLQNALVGAREALRGEAVVLHQILPRLLEFYVSTQPCIVPIEMWPWSFRISWGFGFSFGRAALISGPCWVADIAVASVAEPLPAGFDAVPAGGGVEEEGVDVFSAAGSIKSLVFPEKKIDLSMSPFFLLRSPSSILSRAFRFGGGRGSGSSSGSRSRRGGGSIGGCWCVGGSQCSGERKRGNARLVEVGNFRDWRGGAESRGRYHGHFARGRIDAGLRLANAADMRSGEMRKWSQENQSISNQ